MSQGEEVVMNLAAPLLNQKWHLYFGRFFTSVDVMKQLYEKGTCTGATILKNRRGFPQELKTFKMKQRGDLIQLRKGGVTATAWLDKRQILLLSTNQSPGVTCADNVPLVIAD